MAGLEQEGHRRMEMWRRAPVINSLVVGKKERQPGRLHIGGSVMRTSHLEELDPRGLPLESQVAQTGKTCTEHQALDDTKDQHHNQSLDEVGAAVGEQELRDVCKVKV